VEARAATADDVDEMIRLATVMFESIGLDASGRDWINAAPTVLVDGIGRGLVGAFVVDDPTRPGRLAASAAVVVEQRLPTPHGPDGRIGYVQWVCTDPRFRRQGLGRAVMGAIIGWTRDRGVTRVELHTSPDGRALYEDLGFRPTPPSYRLHQSAPLRSEA
jgi:GNAT superfamily N-acetyltransferase